VSDPTSDINSAATKLEEATNALRTAADNAGAEPAWKDRAPDLVGLAEQVVDIRQQVEILKLLGTP
jgi:hypothetical protein